MNKDMKRKVLMIQQELLKLGFITREREIDKNGVKINGLEIEVEGPNHPVIYIEKLIEEAEEQDMLFKDIIEKIVELINSQPVDADFLKYLTRDYFEEHLFIGMQKDTAVNGAVKRASKYEHIEEYLYLRVDDVIIAGQCITIMLSESNIRIAEMDVEEAWQKAMENTIQDTKIISMNEFVMHQLGIEFPEDDDSTDIIYILTNAGNTKGASAILNYEALREIAKRLNTKKMWGIPSSIHEWIIIPHGICESPLDMLKEVNAHEVEPNEQLSDQVYVLEVE